MKKALIISPYFPPTNTADMQRIRMSLPYFADYGWQVEVVTVLPEYSDLIKDSYLNESIPHEIKIHYVGAFRKNWTRRLGFGNIAYRSFYFYKKYVNSLLEHEKFDLIYFSTTQFSICVLGDYWKRKFQIPYIIDVQDMWHSEYYKSKPKHQRPPKYWLSYRLNKYLEAAAMKNADGLISVSESYLKILSGRYPQLAARPMKTITFGVSEADFLIADKHKDIQPAFNRRNGEVHLVYVGRGGFDIADSLKLIFTALRNLLKKNSDARKLRFNFIGTSYAPSGTGRLTVMPIATQMGVEDYIYEHPDRVGFFEALASLKAADTVFIPGSNDPNYTASKIFPYLLSERPFFAIFNEQSSAVKILQACSGTQVLLLNEEEKTIDQLEQILFAILTGAYPKPELYDTFRQYGARELTSAQVEVFNQVI